MIAMQEKAASTRSDHGAWFAVGWAFVSAPVVAVLLRLPGGGWMALAGYELACVVAMAVGGMSWGSIRWREAAAAGVCTFALLATVLRVLPGLQGVLSAAVPVLETWGMTGTVGGVALVWMVLVNPWIEELFWRGTLLGPRCRRLLGLRASLWLSALGFVPFHVVAMHALFGDAAWSLAGPVLVGSVAWTLMSRWRRSPLPAVFSHQAADLVVVLAVARDVMS
jgi:membrane protease YdiL (CAAX protease family)